MMNGAHMKSCIAALLAIAVVGILSISAVSAGWITFQGNNERNGATSEAGPITAMSVNTAWTAQVGNYFGTSGIDVTPVVGDNGLVYVVDYNGTVYAYYANNGTSVWTYYNWVGHQSDFQLSTPVYVNAGDNNKTLYVALSKAMWVFNGTDYNLIEDQPIVEALNATDGSFIWTKSISVNAEITTPLTYDSENRYLYFGTYDPIGIAGCKYYCLDTNRSGAMAWLNPYDGGSSYYNAGAALIDDYLVFGDESGNVTCVSKLDGSLPDPLESVNQYNASIRSSICYDTSSGVVYFTTNNSYCHALEFNSTSGTFTGEVWNQPLSLGTTSTSTPAVYDGKVYVGVGSFESYYGNSLYCLNAIDGSEVWNYAANGGVQSSPVVYHNDDNVYVYFTTNTASGKVYCVDGSGNMVWSYLPEIAKRNYILQGVALNNGMLYFGNDAGWLFALDDSTD